MVTAYLGGKSASCGGQDKSKCIERAKRAVLEKAGKGVN